MPEEPRSERPSPAVVLNVGDSGAVTDTFGLLSDETRVRILLALDDGPEEGLRFSELRATTGVEDTGRFNYHLKRLRGRLVEKSGEAYLLTPTGESVVEFV